MDYSPEKANQIPLTAPTSIYKIPAIVTTATTREDDTWDQAAWKFHHVRSNRKRPARTYPQPFGTEARDARRRAWRPSAQHSFAFISSAAETRAELYRGHEYQWNRKPV